jgi:hypothetical protein
MRPAEPTAPGKDLEIRGRQGKLIVHWLSRMTEEEVAAMEGRSTSD